MSAGGRAGVSLVSSETDGWTSDAAARRVQRSRDVMDMSALSEQLGYLIAAATTLDELWAVMFEITVQLGFQYFALVHHVDFPRFHGKAFNLHNYPPAWADYFHKHHHAISDPIHRSTYLASTGFPWCESRTLIRVTTDDELHMQRAQSFGIQDGFTVPANIPGETKGSCTFAVATGRALPHRNFPIANWLGGLAFKRGRQILGLRNFGKPSPILSAHQLQCLFWAAQGKTADEIARILGRSRETVVTQLKKAREMYGVYEKTTLVLRAVNDGTLCLGDVIP
jgi:LuxR family quorum-sensing system transcriptional regulator CciR